VNGLRNPFDSLSSAETQVLLEIWEKLVTVRVFEQKVAEYYPQKRMKTPTHLGIGQEAVPVGVLSHKVPGDTVFSHHRSHNAYLAAGGNLEKLVDELHGLSTGCSKGKGGSVHLVDRDVGFIGSSAILGETAAIATGSALSHKLNKSGNVVFAFFGDAGLEEGSSWESFNFASLYNLPIVYVCENNNYSTESHITNRLRSGTNFVNKVSSFGILSEKIYGQDLLEVLVRSQSLIEHCRESSSPVFLEFETRRFYEHVGPFKDFESNKTFRSKQEQIHDSLQDPVDLLFKSLTKAFSVEVGVLNEITDGVTKEVDGLFKKAMMSGIRPLRENLLEDVF
jgi:pyruvate dehydrogenase E1 component alpha subunit